MANNDPSTISTYHLTAHPELYEPARSNAFEFLIHLPEDKLVPAQFGLLAEDQLEEEDYFTGVQDTIRLSVAASSVPHFSLSPIEIRRGNSMMKFAGQVSFDAGSLKINDYVGARTKDILLAWQALAYNVKTDKIQLAANYKHDATLVEYTPDHNDIIRQWTLVGCWISDLSEDEFSHDSSDKRTISVTIQYDRAIPEFEEVEPLQ